MTDRRGFLFGIAGALAAPYIVRAESLMKLWVPEPVMGWESEFGRNGIKIGSQLRIRLPNDFVVNPLEITGWRELSKSKVLQSAANRFARANKLFERENVEWEELGAFVNSMQWEINDYS